MKMTPLDIQNHKFRSRLWGRDPEEVAIFMEMAATELEERIKENQFLTDELARAKSQLSEFREREQTLKETMMMAQKIAQDMKNNVVKEAQVILSEAELEADRILERAQGRVVELEEKILELKRSRILLEEDLRATLTTHLKLLEVGKEAEAEQAEQEEKVKRLVAKSREK
jgi:cell division initiation protein